MKSVCVPTFSAETIHGPQGRAHTVSNQDRHRMLGCGYGNAIESGAEMKILVIYAKERDEDAVRWLKNTITINKQGDIMFLKQYIHKA